MTRLLAALTAFLVLIVPDAHAQFSAEALAGTAANDFIGEYAGAAVSARYVPFKTVPLGLTAGSSLSFHSTSFRATVCDAYWPQFSNCTNEKINSTGRTTSFSLGTVVAPALGAWRPAVEIGVEWSDLSIEAAADSSRRRTGSIFPGDYDEYSGTGFLGTNGRYIAASIARAIGPKLSVSVALRSRWFDYRVCATDVGTPFCEEYSSGEARLGIEFTP